LVWDNFGVIGNHGIQKYAVVSLCIWKNQPKLLKMWVKEKELNIECTFRKFFGVNVLTIGSAFESFR